VKPPHVLETVKRAPPTIGRVSRNQTSKVATVAEFSPETSQDNEASSEWATPGVIFDS